MNKDYDVDITITIRKVVMIPALDPDFHLFGNLGFRFGYSKKQNRNTYRGVMIPALDPDPE